MAPLTAYGAYSVGKYALDKWGKGLTAKLMGDPEAMKAFEDYTKGKYARKDGKWVYGDKHAKAGQSITLPSHKAKLDRLYNASNERSWKNLFKGGPKMGGAGGLLAYMIAEPLAEQIGGEVAGDVVGTGIDAALLAGGARTLGMGLMGKGVHGSLLGAGLMAGAGAYGLYDRYFGDED